MEQETNLRALRLQYDIPLPELSLASGLSAQYINQVELGKRSPTASLEEKLGAAMDAVIVGRHVRLSGLERRYEACKGRLLQPAEGDPDE